MPFSGWRSPRPWSSSRNRLRSSARSMASICVPSTFTPSACSPCAHVERGLAAELEYHPGGALLVVDVGHILHGERFEVEAVGGVVVGGHGLRVAVDHDRLVAAFAQGVRRLAATVVELDALADAVGAAADDHHLVHRLDRNLILHLVGGVEVRGVRLGTPPRRCPPACRAGRTPSSSRRARIGLLVAAGQFGQLAVRKAGALGTPHRIRVQSPSARHHLPESALQIQDLRHVVDEPGIDAGVLRRPRRRSCRAPAPPA